FIDRHYCDEFYPSSIDEYLMEVFSSKFQDIPLEILLKRESFLAYLQKEWEIFLLSYVDESKKSIVPFDNKDIKVYMDNYFLEGLLRPVLIYKPAKIPVWARPGLIGDNREEDMERFKKLFEIIKEEIPSEKSPCNDWLNFAVKWAKCLKTYHEIKKPSDREEIEQFHLNIEEPFEQLHLQIEEKFGKWMIDRYSPIISLSYYPHPRMVHKILPYISYKLKEESKAALIIIDGMSLDEWLLVKECLVDNEAFQMIENRIFAMVPTITSVSRQSILSGRLPKEFSFTDNTTEETTSREISSCYGKQNFINTTAKEETFWKNFWEKEGKKKPFFLKNQKFTEISVYGDAMNSSVMAVIINDIDDANHDSKGNRGVVYSTIKYWINEGIFSRFIKELLLADFTVYITSDHGNISTIGTGMLKDRNLSESKGKRAHIFENVERRDIALKNERGIKWIDAGLPDNYFPLLATGKEAFTKEDEKNICHGGISLEEVIVPFIEIRRKKDG
ncbi:MAG: BREX-3 system phosphatase PglZ, partial [Candidatus Eremiobacterota bacterium]